VTLLKWRCDDGKKGAKSETDDYASVNRGPDHIHLRNQNIGVVAVGLVIGETPRYMAAISFV